jgi:hypothetical protein
LASVVAAFAGISEGWSVKKRCEFPTLDPTGYKFNLLNVENEELFGLAVKRVDYYNLSYIFQVN